MTVLLGTSGDVGSQTTLRVLQSSSSGCCNAPEEELTGTGGQMNDRAVSFMDFTLKIEMKRRDARYPERNILIYKRSGMSDEGIKQTPEIGELDIKP